MMEMHTFQKARKTEILSQNGDKSVSARNLFVFLCKLCEWVHLTPFIHYNRRPESDAVYVLFDHVAFAEDDFWQLFGTTMVILHTRWQIDVFSTESSTQDTVCLSLEECGGRFYGVQKNVSGRPSDTMQAICLRIKCLSPEQAELLQAAFKSTDWKKGIVVVDGMYCSFLKEENLISICHNSCFCYGGVIEDTEYGDYLQALSFTQKTALWAGFLEDGFDYMEFEWLYNEISNATLANRTEWELSLHTAMQNMEYSLTTLPCDFELYDGQKNRRYYSFNSGKYSERAFLKILFPLNL